MEINHDLHIHTTLSACCNDESAIPEKIIERARDRRLNTVALTNHIWDNKLPGALPWYRPQTVDHVLSIKERIPADTAGVRILLGCEADYHGPGKISLDKDGAAQFDWVLVSMSHLHMHDYYRNHDLSSPKKIGNLMVRRFHEALDLEIAGGLAHPLLPIGHLDRTDDVMAAIPEKDLRECFRHAAETGTSIEITLSFFPGLTGAGETEGRHDETYIRMLIIAREEGCLFHFASDSHTLAGVGNVRLLADYAERIGITEEHLIITARHTPG